MLMDVDKDNLDMMEVDEDVAFEIRPLRKRLRKVENDKEELETTLPIRDDALDGYKEQLEEKTTEAQKWLGYSEQVCGQLSHANKKSVCEKSSSRPRMTRRSS
jgi:chromosome segregation ATPase